MAAPAPSQDDAPVELCDEALEVRRRRFKEARHAGLSLVEAELFADCGGDVGALRRLVKAGCKPSLIAEILL